MNYNLLHYFPIFSPQWQDGHVGKISSRKTLWKQIKFFPLSFFLPSFRSYRFSSLNIITHTPAPLYPIYTFDSSFEVLENWPQFSLYLIDDQCTKRPPLTWTLTVGRMKYLKSLNSCKKVELGTGGNRSSFQLPTPSQSSEEEKDCTLEHVALKMCKISTYGIL